MWFMSGLHVRNHARASPHIKSTGVIYSTDVMGSMDAIEPIEPITTPHTSELIIPTDLVGTGALVPLPSPRTGGPYSRARGVYPADAGPHTPNPRSLANFVPKTSLPYPNLTAKPQEGMAIIRRGIAILQARRERGMRKHGHGKRNHR